MKKLNKKDLAEFISARYDNINKNLAENLVNSLFWKIEQEIKQGNEVSIVGFGKFFIKTLEERIATNPQNGQKFLKEKRKTIKFKCGKNFKNINEKNK